MREREVSVRRDYFLGSIDVLKSEILVLKQEVLYHRNCESELIYRYIAASAYRHMRSANCFEILGWSERSRQTKFGTPLTDEIPPDQASASLGTVHKGSLGPAARLNSAGQELCSHPERG